MENFDDFQTSITSNACSVFLSSYGVLGAKAQVIGAERQRVLLAFDRWEFPALEVGSTVTLSLVFSNSSGSVLYSPATVTKRAVADDHVIFDVEVDAEDGAAQSALSKLESLIGDDSEETPLRAAEH